MLGCPEVCIGTGGTFTGVAKRLKEHNPNLKAIAVEPTGSPAIKGGLQVGDVIVQMEDTIITDAASYQQFLEARNPGEKIKIGVMRYTQKSYQKVNLSVTVAEKNKQ